MILFYISNSNIEFTIIMLEICQECGFARGILGVFVLECLRRLLIANEEDFENTILFRRNENVDAYEIELENNNN